ncbi:MAG: 4Fe-4S dicluster domain-containing protein [Nitrospinae bacterium]|nr:4Fe-4S dicluster domain-containing protein [Nitrospinota bacterium]
MFKIDIKGFNALLSFLRHAGYAALGPTIRDGAIVYDEIGSTEDMPVGMGDAQEPGRYRLAKRDDDAIFGYGTSPQSWKKYFNPPRSKLFTAVMDGAGFKVVEEKPPATKLALIGVRPCELAALKIQDKIFFGGEFADKAYQARRENVLIIAVNCTAPCGTCFCASMNTGPAATGFYDICLTEVLKPGVHYFVALSGSEMGKVILSGLPGSPLGDQERQEAETLMKAAGQKMGRKLDTTGIKELLYGSYENKRWNEVAERCLACANCTMVCPTCFCSGVEDVTDLSGQKAERWKKWDSCFEKDFSYIHGGSVRQTHLGRYRQWMIHKLAAWHDQFGSSGCVGCGRCITWCPVGIDITEEAAAIRASSTAGAHGSGDK